VSLAVLRANLWFHRYTALAWIVGVGLLAFLVGALYRSAGGPDYLKLIDQMPDALKVSMGLDPNTPLSAGDGLSMSIWLNTQFLSYGAILFAIYAVVHGSAAIAREAEKGTLDLVLSQPIRRSQFVVSRGMVFVISSTVLALATALTLVAGLAVIGETTNIPHLLLTVFQAWLVALAVAGYSFAFSCLFLSTAKAGAAAGLLTTAFYAIDIVARTVQGVSWLGNLSLFHFYEPQHVLDTGELSWVGIVVCGSVAIGAAAAAAAIFQRRDILT
jgi:ABC-2 type transport system permease protein